MVRILVLAAALGALAIPAAAESVTVNIAGLDAKAVHAKIVRAAEQACDAVYGDSLVTRYYAMPSCVTEAVATAEAKFATNDHRFAAVQNGR
ncbi:MAG TPA: UrcA family protein [Caulobacteraceae bacterium]|jgi:UrcA family protein|nr:UrcA family protein [Caulobacteraceae bacterium]